MTKRPTAVIILAAGEGTRMKSSLPKVMHRIGGRSLLGHAVAAAAGTQPAHLAVVVRHQRDLVAEHIRELDDSILVADQDEIKGTGRATESGLAALPDDLTGAVLVTGADTPLLSTDTLLALLEQQQATDSAVTVLTARVSNPHGYGRVVRDDNGDVLAIVEEKDATDEQRAIDEINSGVYAFDAAVLRAGLTQITDDTAQGERYLTDMVQIAREAGHRVSAQLSTDPWETEGVNDRVQLAQLGREMNSRVCEKLMRDGVTIVDPATTWIDVEVTIGPDTIIEPGTQLLGATSIASGAQIGPETTLRDTSVGAGASVRRTEAYLAVIGEQATIGPFSYLRPGTVVGTGGKVGGFVETKNAAIGDGAKVPHLTYCGDATIGEGANIGAGTIFANYDGVAKHHTVVGRHAFVGSDSVLVAPVEIADGAYVAAGSTVTADVDPGDIAVARARQRNVPGWVSRSRPGTATATAAQAAADAGSRHQDTSDSKEQA